MTRLRDADAADAEGTADAECIEVAPAPVTASIDEPVLPVAEPDHGGHLQRMRGESLLLTFSYGLIALVGVGFWAIAARTEPAAILGEATAVISAFTAAAVVGATGLANALLAMVPIAGAARGRLLTYGYAIVVSTCLVTGLIAGVIAALAVPAIGSPVGTAAAITVVSVIWGVFVLQDAVLISLGKAKWLLAENFPMSVAKLGMLPVLAALVGTGGHPVVVSTVVPALVAVVIVTGIAVPRLVRATPHDALGGGPQDEAGASAWMAAHRREFQLFALRDGAASAMGLGLFMFLPFLVTATAGGVQGAVFALSLQISNAMDLFTVGVGVSLTTTVAADHAAGPAVAREMWKRLARIVAGVAVLVAAGSPVLLLIFGRTYLDHHGWEVVVILAVGSLLRTTFEVWTSLLRALRRTAVLLVWVGLTSSVLLAAVLVGAHLGGAVGAAVGVAGATLVSSTVGALGLAGRIGHGVPRLLGGGQMEVEGANWPWEGFPPADDTGVHQTATWFGPTERSLFGWLTAPESGLAARAIVLCPPLAHEERLAHRTFRHLGVELARRGVVTLCVDYAGTGDSAGGQHEPGRVAAWQDSIRAAAHYLQAMGIPEIGLVGMRMGATLAAAVAAEGGYGSVALWDPCAGGRSFVREAQSLHALSEGQHDEPVEPDDVLVPGFRFDAATVADLRPLALAGLPAHKWCARMLVLTRTGRPVGGAALAGPHVEWGIAHAQPALLGTDPSGSRMPLASLTQVAEWLAADTDPALLSAFTLDTRSETTLPDPRSGTLVRERFVELGPQRLFGIVCEPLEPAPDAPWVLLSNVAVESHSGPGRCWADFSRAWAAMGLRCLRFDHSGLGDSPLRPGQQESRIFDPLALDDYAEVYDALASGPAPVAAMGLCSGGYMAFEAALRRPFAAVHAVAAHVTYPQMALGEAGYSPRRLAARPYIRPLARLFHRDTMAAAGLWRLYRQVAAWHAPMSAVRALLGTGTHLRLLANPKDAEGYREVAWWTLARRRTTVGTGRYALEVDDRVDHALLTHRGQQVAFADATRFWVERFGVHDPVGTPDDPFRAADGEPTVAPTEDGRLTHTG